jgi:hypothetical protein
MNYETRIVIPNVECLTKKQYEELTNYLEACPIGYEEQNINFKQNGTD